MGDFNQIISLNEKLISNTTIIGADVFAYAINACGLIDIILTSNWFTWSNYKVGDDMVWERLDQVLVSSD